MTSCHHDRINLQPNFQKGGGLTGPQLLEGGCWERRGDLFQGGFQFQDKQYLKIFNDKKSLYISKNIVLCHNSNQEMLTKNLDTFKR